MNTRTHAVAIAAALATAACTPTLAQSGTVRVLADNQAAITITPGTPVRLDLIAEAPVPGVQLSHLEGDLRLSADAGTPSNFFTPLAGPSAVVLTGSFQGGSRLGMTFISQPPFFGPVPAAWSATPVHVLSYDIQFDTPGTYTAIWQPHPSEPDARWFSLPVGHNPTPTEYVAATITVIPTPASLTLLALAPVCRTARRRPAR